jgi:hypothetical protein
MCDPSSWRTPAPRVGAALAVTLLLAEAACLLVLLPHSEPFTLPVTATFGAVSLDIAQVDVRAASVILCLIVAAARVPSLLSTASVDTVGPRADAGRRVAAVTSWSEPLLVTPIIVFLLAGLNGVTEVSALVSLYALASAGVLLTRLQREGGRASLVCAAAVGIVPWGVIAFSQIGALVVGEGPSMLTRVLTLGMLALALGGFVAEWRERRHPRSPRVPSPATALFRVTSVSVLGWGALSLALVA